MIDYLANSKGSNPLDDISQVIPAIINPKAIWYFLKYSLKIIFLKY